MKRIRKGKSIECTLTVLTDGEAQELDKKTLNLKLVRPDGVRVRLPIRATEGNEARFTVLPSVQLDYGRYGFELWKDDGGRWQTVADVPHAFELVGLTQQEGGDDEVDLETSTLDMTARFTGGFAVIDNLESTRTDAALSANMGRELGLRMEAAEATAAGAMETAEAAAGDAATAKETAGTASSEATSAKETAEAAMTAVGGKQDALTAGTNISLEDCVVSCTLTNVSELANDAGYIVESELTAITDEEIDALFE